MDFNFRPADEEDREFLFALYCQTMHEVVEQTWGWDEAWQRSDFDRRFDNYSASIVESDSQSVGGLLLEITPDSIYIHELQLLPSYQGGGIGTAVVRHVIAQGVERGVPVILSVVPANHRAQRLYERLGFTVTGVEAPFIRMRWSSFNPTAV